MEAKPKPKHLVLQDITAALLRINPMKLGRDNPLEYELEALSILSRFSESALQMCDDEATIAKIATGIVSQALDFWFENVEQVNCEVVARELLGIFKASFDQTGEVNHTSPSE